MDERRKTKDGVVAVPGMTLFCIGAEASCGCRLVRQFYYDDCSDTPQDIAECYFDREVARLAGHTCTNCRASGWAPEDGLP